MTQVINNFKRKYQVGGLLKRAAGLATKRGMLRVASRTPEIPVLGRLVLRFEEWHPRELNQARLEVLDNTTIALAREGLDHKIGNGLIAEDPEFFGSIYKMDPAASTAYLDMLSDGNAAYWTLKENRIPKAPLLLTVEVIEEPIVELTVEPVVETAVLVAPAKRLVPKQSASTSGSLPIGTIYAWPNGLLYEIVGPNGMSRKYFGDKRPDPKLGIEQPKPWKLEVLEASASSSGDVKFDKMKINTSGAWEKGIPKKYNRNAKTVLETEKELMKNPAERRGHPGKGNTVPELFEDIKTHKYGKENGLMPEEDSKWAKARNLVAKLEKDPNADPKAVRRAKRDLYNVMKWIVNNHRDLFE